MAVRVVDVIQDNNVVGTAVSEYQVTTIVNTAQSTVVNNLSVPATEIVGPNVIANVVVSSTPPAHPFEGQIWIDIS